MGPSLLHTVPTMCALGPNDGQPLQAPGQSWSVHSAFNLFEPELHIDVGWALPYEQSEPCGQLNRALDPCPCWLFPRKLSLHDSVDEVQREVSGSRPHERRTWNGLCYPVGTGQWCRCGFGKGFPPDSLFCNPHPMELSMCSWPYALNGFMLRGLCACIHSG